MSVCPVCLRSVPPFFSRDSRIQRALSRLITAVSVPFNVVTEEDRKYDLGLTSGCTLSTADASAQRAARSGRCATPYQNTDSDTLDKPPWDSSPNATPLFRQKLIDWAPWLPTQNTRFRFLAEIGATEVVSGAGDERGCLFADTAPADSVTCVWQDGDANGATEINIQVVASNEAECLTAVLELDNDAVTGALYHPSSQACYAETAATEITSASDYRACLLDGPIPSQKLFLVPK